VEGLRRPSDFGAAHPSPRRASNRGASRKRRALGHCAPLLRPVVERRIGRVGRMFARDDPCPGASLVCDLKLAGKPTIAIGRAGEHSRGSAQDPPLEGVLPARPLHRVFGSLRPPPGPDPCSAGFAVICNNSRRSKARGSTASAQIYELT
jgi:hypothetical protein